MPHPTDGSYRITSSSPQAVAHYRKGVELVLRSSVEARPVLAAALAADDQMAVALVALAVAIGAGPEADVLLDRALARGRSATRRERQHVEIVVDALRGDGPRARALAAEHLAEFPGDALIAHLGASHEPPSPGARAASATFQAAVSASPHGEPHTATRGNPMQATSIDDLSDRSAAPPSTVDAPTSPGHVGRIVVGTTVGGLVAAGVAVVGPFAGSPEHVITGSMLVVFAVSWALLATLTTRHTDQPQRWAAVPATVMGAAGASMLLFAPTGNELGWVWPPAVLALVVWMVRRARRDLRSRARIFVLYPVFVVLALSAAGGAIETYAEARDPGAGEMPGRLVSVGDHRLHIDCTGTGSPTVVLEAGLAEISTMMSAWLAPDLATTTRVCVYDRAGRGWSESAAGPQDGEQVAADLHTLLQNAGEQGPFVLAGHSAGGIYVLNFAKLHPDEVAGVALLDAMHPEQYDRMASWPAFYEMFRRGSALMPTMARLGIGRLAYGGAFEDLPNPQRDLERRLIATPRHARSVREEFRMIRTAMDQAAELQDLGDLPLVVLTAERDADPDWAGMQDDLATLSSDTLRRFLPGADHTTVVEDEEAAGEASDAILVLVEAIRTGTPVAAEGR